MKRIFFLVLVAFSFPLWSTVALEVNKPLAYGKTKMIIIPLEARSFFWGRSVDKELREVADIMKHDIEFGGQCTVSIKTLDDEPTKEHMQQLAREGFQVALFLSHEKKQQTFDWRLYDLGTITMVAGKKYAQSGTCLRGWAHALSDIIWPLLTGQEGFFSSKLVYCKKIALSKAKAAEHIYIADYDGSNEQLLVATKTVNVAPSWNRDMTNPLVFYSEHTNQNVRLVMVDMAKRRKVVSDFAGLNMLPAFSSDGKKVVYCISNGKGLSQLYSYEQGKLSKLPHKPCNGRKLEHGINLAPSFADKDNALYFCSDFETGYPRIYKYDFAHESTECITPFGYCASPAYSIKRKQLAYTRMIKGTMQIFVYDEETKKHRQLTTDRGNKESCSWSPCGHYLAFAVEEGLKSKIAVMQVDTGTKRYVTQDGQVCSYPSWSPLYSVFPVVYA